MSKRLSAATVVVLVPLLLTTSACAIKSKGLDRIAKDWCETIRASQVLPVYPLSEDVQPGDVFLVQTPLSKQQEIYKKKGFLPLSQLITRLPSVPADSTFDYDDFYRDAYWKGTYARAPFERPGPTGSGDGEIMAPRAAFPSYTFSVEKGAGLNLAIPIQSVPVGLGVMGAQKATGSVTIRDAYTYGIDNEELARALWCWWSVDKEAKEMLVKIAKTSDQPIYLRAVNRVYLTHGVTVSLTNLSSKAFGAKAGQPPELEMIDLSSANPERAAAAAEAREKALGALSKVSAAGQPGGSFQFTQASQRSVSMDEDFDRPLVIGYLGFDVQVYDNGALSPPIPSFAALNKRLPANKEKTSNDTLTWSGYTKVDEAFTEWLKREGCRDKIIAFLAALGIYNDPADLVANPDLECVLHEASREFDFSSSCMESTGGL